MGIQIMESDYDLQNGFAWTRFEIDGNPFTLQACLMEREECSDVNRRQKLIVEGKPIFKKTINEGDDGMDWGICGDMNRYSFHNLSPETRRQAFRKAMRQIGIKFY